MVAEAGRLRFLDDRKLQAIADALHDRGLPRLPLRTVQRLTDRFLVYHLAAHLESFPHLRDELARRGGYVLVLDGTGISGRMTLVLTDDDASGGTGWTLLAAPIEKEDVVEVGPHLARLRRALGPPLSGISDDREGLRDSFRAIFPGNYLLLCQFHVLRAIGETLTGKLYRRFKQEVDRSGAKGRLRRLARRLRAESSASREARQTLVWTEEILGWEKAAHGRTVPVLLGGPRVSPSVRQGPRRLDRPAPPTRSEGEGGAVSRPGADPGPPPGAAGVTAPPGPGLPPPRDEVGVVRANPSGAGVPERSGAVESDRETLREGTRAGPPTSGLAAGQDR